MKTTKYFDAMKERQDRAIIKEEWIQHVMTFPDARVTQSDGRIRIWGRVAEMDNRYLRVVLLEDGITVHNAFFDRGFRP